MCAAKIETIEKSVGKEEGKIFLQLFFANEKLHNPSVDLDVFVFHTTHKH